MTVAAVTDRGLQHHRNEDAFAIAVAAGYHIVVVCDGVSSTADSHLAARNASAAARNHLVSAAHAGTRADEALRTAIAVAAQAAAAVGSREHQVPSCTIVAALAGPAGAATIPVAIAWLGDSRAYLINSGKAALLTEDDSLAANYKGEPIEQIYSRPESHTITRWLGADAPDTEPRLATTIAAEGDRLLVCSDGLWNYALRTEALSVQIERLGRRQTPLALAQSLVRFANECGGADNTTVAIVQLGESI